MHQKIARQGRCTIENMSHNYMTTDGEKNKENGVIYTASIVLLACGVWRIGTLHGALVGAFLATALGPRSGLIRVLKGNLLFLN
jgi:hypothetical protein